MAWLSTLGKAAKVAYHTTFFKTDSLTALGTDFSKEAVTITMLFIEPVFQIPFLQDSAYRIRY